MMNKDTIQQHIAASWDSIVPFWPLESLVAVNPLFSFIDKPFESALQDSYSWSQNHKDFQILSEVNKKTIQWCQLFFDQGQATIAMPYKSLGFYQAVKKLMIVELLDSKQKNFIEKLSDDSLEAIETITEHLGCEESQQEELYTTALKTLSGWSRYICYWAHWARNAKNKSLKYDFLAIRLLYMYLYKIFPHMLLKPIKRVDVAKDMKMIEEYEQSYSKKLLSSFATKFEPLHTSKVQFVFCMDIRSESIRRALEQRGLYETFGMAGFFGAPITVVDGLLKKKYDACPVLIKPQHTIKNNLLCTTSACKKQQQKRISLKQIFDTVYKALKYTFVAPFALVEILGPVSFIGMILRFVSPCLAMRWQSSFSREEPLKGFMWPMVDEDQEGNGIPFNDQVLYAKQLLHTIGLKNKDQFSELIVLTAHRGNTTNNAYATMLDCGACGGHPGLVNAKVMATILNNPLVRQELTKESIEIPDTSYFIAAEHNTTTDQIMLYDNQDFNKVDANLLQQVKHDLQVIQKHCATERVKTLPGVVSAQRRSCNWSEVIPEWGLANNAALVIGPRWLTEKNSLNGRVFLHSYDHIIDGEHTILESILTAPMVVAHWINGQYLFSTLHNTEYGSGSKITQNPVGKLGVMQGNMSDLMSGLPMQSVCIKYDQSYHQPIRLNVVVYAYRKAIQSIISRHALLQDLCKNEWIHMIACDPEDQKIYRLQKDFSWKIID